MKLRTKKPKIKYYSLDDILTKNAQYNVIFGERSNGKTFSVQDYAVRRYWSTGQQLAVVRRWVDDFRGKRGATMFDGVVNAGVVKEITDGEWTHIYYYSYRWYFARLDENGKVEHMDEPFAYGFAITAMEHDKSTSYPNITTILFDEFLTRKSYLPDEFVLFMNVISTIIRYRDDVTIFMLGNTVNQYCPYFQEMGLTKIKTMQPGDIHVYEYGESGLRVAVEYSDSPNKFKPSDKYFAFDNPKLSMITGGAWELAIYPHLPVKYKPKDVLFTYFISFNEELLQCEIIQHDDTLFTYIHRKTTPLKEPDRDIVFSPNPSHRPNFKRRLTKPTNRMEKVIYHFFAKEKVFYQDNTVGEVVRNYLLWCSSPIISP